MELTGNLIIKAIDSNICDSYHEIIPNLYLGNKNTPKLIHGIYI